MGTKPRGFAWTLDTRTAEFFTYTYRRSGRSPGHVFKATIRRRNVIAYLGEREEAEILLFAQAARGCQVLLRGGHELIAD